ncbi:endonuclease III [Candidatus Pacearchaeota archaeon]|nr:endonuclease III [Candidatus Pacearchaeota archaeon]|tara:strand:- start:694 stop:1305 length:612 start_codon:yes stop_codon:yes gene_type:complete
MNQEKAVWQLKEIEKLVGGGGMRLAAEWTEKWKILISTILSAQTKDETTIAISEILYKKYNSAEKLGSASLRDIEKIIRPVNYYKTKARHIKATAGIISKKGIPRDIDGLLGLAGVGRKVGNVYLAVAHNADVIGVDTHVARISRKMGWTLRRQDEKHKIEKDLEKLFPKEYWRSLNYILVRFGRMFGRSRKREDEILETLIK